MSLSTSLPITHPPSHFATTGMLALLLTAPLAISACNKDKTGPVAPDELGSTQVADEPDVPQEPDPPEIQAGAHEYLVGNFQRAIDLLAPVYEDSKARKQYRASGLAAGWLTLAHARLVFENGQEPTQHALAMGAKTRDPEVIAMSKLAQGAMLLGNDEYDAAAKAFDEAARAAPQTTAGALANVLRAETRIGSAFGNAESNALENPRELQTAREAYKAAADAAKTGAETSLILGRVEEGLAAVSKYLNDKDGVCKHAAASIEHYRAGGASEFMIEGPTQLAVAERCDLPGGR